MDPNTDFEFLTVLRANSHSAACIVVHSLYKTHCPLFDPHLSHSPPQDFSGDMVKRFLQVNKSKEQSQVLVIEIFPGQEFLLELPTYSNCIFILHLTPVFNGLGKDNCNMRWETFNLGDLVHLVLKVWQYLVCCTSYSIDSLGSLYVPSKVRHYLVDDVKKLTWMLKIMYNSWVKCYIASVTNFICFGEQFLFNTMNQCLPLSGPLVFRLQF